MMATIFGGIMLLWFWGSSHKTAFFARNFNSHIKKLEDLLVVTTDSEDPTAPHKLRLVDSDKPVSFSPLLLLQYFIHVCLCGSCLLTVTSPQVSSKHVSL